MSESETNIAGLHRGGQFQTTHWSVVLLAGKKQVAQSAVALEKLCRAYWHPIYAFARRRGAGEEDAKDLTQQFFSRLLERNDFAGVDPQKGKFRTFLLTAFTHFLANEYDRAHAQKRGGGKILFSLDELLSDPFHRFEPADSDSPANLFDQRWAWTILEQALSRLKNEMTSAGKSLQFDALKNFLTTEAETGDYSIAARQLCVEQSTIAVLVHRLRQRFRELVRVEVMQTVSSPSELEEEMRHLFHLLNQ